MKIFNNLSKSNLSKVSLYKFITYVIILMTFFAVVSFISSCISDKGNYELKQKYESGQKIYMLYKDGAYYDDVDYNEFNLTTSGGGTDYRYCLLIHNARNLTFMLILSAMLILVFRIADSKKQGTPFTHKNANRVKAIGFLQYSLSIVPYLVVFIMKMARFQYIYAPIQIEQFYLVVIGFVILMIGRIFDYGVKLQEDNDLIA